MALGTDSSASNNSQDILEEMRFASLLQRELRGDPLYSPPAQSLAMATSAAGPATGFSLGHLAIQEPADLILVSRRGASLAAWPEFTGRSPLCRIRI